jgi:hypothetical protein
MFGHCKPAMLQTFFSEIDFIPKFDVQWSVNSDGTSKCCSGFTRVHVKLHYGHDLDEIGD